MKEIEVKILDINKEEIIKQTVDYVKKTLESS